MGTVTHIRNQFLSTQDYSVGHVPSQMHNSLKSSSSQVSFYFYLSICMSLHGARVGRGFV